MQPGTAACQSTNPEEALAELRPGVTLVWIDSGGRARRGVMLALVAPGEDPGSYLPAAARNSSRCRFRTGACGRKRPHCLVQVDRGDNQHDGKPLAPFFFLPCASRVTSAALRTKGVG